MRSIIQASITCMSLLATLCLAEEAWPGVKFSEVRAYAWPNDNTTHAVILPDMKLKEGAINPAGTKLSDNQAQALIRATTGEHPAYLVARCHIPHNAFVFYDAAGKPVASLEVCFACLSHRVSPSQGAARKLDLLAIAGIFDALKLPMGAYSSLSAFKRSFKPQSAK